MWRGTRLRGATHGEKSSRRRAARPVDGALQDGPGGPRRTIAVAAAPRPARRAVRAAEDKRAIDAGCAPGVQFCSNAAMSASVTSFCTLRMSLMTFSIGVRVYSASTTSKWLAESPSHSAPPFRVALRRPAGKHDDAMPPRAAASAGLRRCGRAIDSPNSSASR